ncbi:MAG TPA: ABC transporter permease [Micropepsaceae bacterium]|nr:ABC transporter permease [Micropepsaceae bacterium]
MISSARLVQLAFAIIAGGFWYLVTETGAVSPLFLPAPNDVAAALIGLIGTDEFWSAIRVTLTTIAGAYALAVIAGVLTGYALTRSRLLTRAFEPVVSGAFAIPITLFFPLFILFFGIGPQSKLAYGAVYGFFPVAINTIAGFANVERRLVDAARSMGIGRAGILRHVLFPAAFPVILTGLRIGFFICFASVLGGEAISSASGIGHNIALTAELFEPAQMYAWIVCVAIAALALNGAVSAIDRRFRET